MRAGWVAGSVRARLLLGQRAGAELAQELAHAASLARALDSLLLSPVVIVPAAGRGATLEEAQRAVASSVALSARVLAAWLPRDAVAGIRALASWFELANIEDRIAYLEGGELRTPFELGVLSTVWEAAADARDADELRRLLARSPWGDPGSDDPLDLLLWLRLSWANRVAAEIPAARSWAGGAVAILLATEMFLARRFFDRATAQRLGLGESWASATSVPELRTSLPAWAAWSLEEIDDPAGLWDAELAWWRRVALDADALVRGRLDSSDVVVGALALLAVDAVRVNAALAVAERAGSGAAEEVLDALC